MKILALDFGAQRIGVAIGDSRIGVAAARDFLRNDSEIFDSLIALVEREGFDKILVGLPRGFQGDTEQTLIVQNFAQKLSAKIAPPIELIDERFTSRIATDNLYSAGHNSRQQKNLIDSESARIILQEYLDANF